MRQLVYLFVFCAFSLYGQEKMQNVQAPAFNKLIATGNYILVDLRTPAEISKKGKIAGAKEIDFLAIDSENQIEALDRDKMYLLYCAGGGRSSECASLMEEKGFKKVINLEGGFDLWVKRGFPVELKKQ